MLRESRGIATLVVFFTVEGGRRGGGGGEEEEEGCFVTYLPLLPHTPAMFVTSVIRTVVGAGGKWQHTRPVVFSGVPKDRFLLTNGTRNRVKTSSCVY